MSAEILEAVLGLRAVADLLEKHTDIPAPYSTVGHGVVIAHWFLQHLDNDPTPEQQHAEARRVFAALGGTWAQSTRREKKGPDVTVWTRNEGVIGLQVEDQGPVLVGVPS